MANLFNTGSDYNLSYSYYVPFGYKFHLLHAQNCGCADLGTLNWTYQSSSNRFVCSPSDIFSVSGYSVSDFYQQKYTQSTARTDKTIFHNGGSIIIYDYDYTDATAFKSAMSGVYLYYQRTTDTSWTAPTKYIVYTDEQLLNIGDTADELSYLNGEVLNIEKYECDGTEDWAAYARLSNCYYIKLADAKASTGTSVLCTHYEGKAQGTDKGVYVGAGDISGVQCGAFYFTDTDYADVTAWAAMVAAQAANGTPITLYFIRRVATTKAVSMPEITYPTGLVYFDYEGQTKPSSAEVKYYSRSVSA